MITGEQIRAARAYMGWSQTELGERANCSLSTIAKIERLEGDVGADILEKIRRAFEQEGMFFTDDGLVKRSTSMYTIEGERWFLELLQDVQNTLQDKGGELLVDMADDTKSPPDVIEMYRRIREIGVNMRQTVEEGNTYLIGPIKEYRWIPHNRFKNWVTLIYGDKVAISIDNESKCIVFKDRNFSKAEKNKFDLIWDLLPELKIESAANVRF